MEISLSIANVIIGVTPGPLTLPSPGVPIALSSAMGHGERIR